MTPPDLAWTAERLPRLPRNNFWYFLMCLLALRPRRRMTYAEMYLLMVETNRKRLGEEKAKRLAFKRITDFYEYNNGDRPV